MILKKILLINFLTITALCATGQDRQILFQEKSWAEILDLAKQKKQYIFLDCYTSWCGPCKGMATNVFTNNKVADFMNANFICTHFDMEKGEGKNLHVKYKSFIPGFPTYLIIDSTEKVLYQSAGYMDPDKFIRSMSDGLSGNDSWVIMKERYNNNERNWDFLWVYTQALEKAYQKNDINIVVKYILENLTIEDVSNNESAYNLFKTYWKDTQTELFRTYMSQRFSLYRKYQKERFLEDHNIYKLYKRQVDDFVKACTEDTINYDFDAEQAMINDLKRESFGERERLYAIMRINHAVKVRDFKTFFYLVDAGFDFEMLDSGCSAMIIDWVALMAENTKDKKALRKLIFYLPNLDKISQNHDLMRYRETRVYASILEKLGKKNEAMKYYKQADEEEAAFKEKYKDILKLFKKDSTKKEKQKTD